MTPRTGSNSAWHDRAPWEDREAVAERPRQLWCPGMEGQLLSLRHVAVGDLGGPFLPLGPPCGHKRKGADSVTVARGVEQVCIRAGPLLLSPRNPSFLCFISDSHTQFHLQVFFFPCCQNVCRCSGQMGVQFSKAALFCEVSPEQRTVTQNAGTWVGGPLGVASFFSKDLCYFY